MKKNKTSETMKSVRKLNVIIIVLLLLVTVAACSSQEEEFDLSLVFGNIERDDGHDRDFADTRARDFDWRLLDNFNRDIMQRPVGAVSPFYGETLIILINYGWYNQHRMRQMANGFELMHPGVSVEFAFSYIVDNRIYFGVYDDALDVFLRDHPPVLIQASTVGYPLHETNDFFADWRPVLQRHSDFDEDEWNMNVLSASFIDNELIAFPAMQTIRFFSANSTIPGLAEVFYMSDGKTTNELLDLYVLFEAQNDGFSLAVGYFFSYFISFHLPAFFDYNNRRVEFNSEEFVELLEILSYGVSIRDFVAFQTAVMLVHYTVRGAYAVDLISRDMLFYRNHLGFIDIDVFGLIDYDSYFVNPVPIVTEDGMLQVWPGFPSYSWILGSHDPVYQALAAEFLLFMAGVFGQGIDSGNSPFYAYAAFNTWGLNGIPARLNGFARSGDIMRLHMDRIYPNRTASWRFDEAHAFATINEHMTHFGSMEMRRANVHPRSIRAIIIGELTSFVDGASSADITAQNLQAWLEGAIAGGR